MAVLKQIKFGTGEPIAIQKSVVAINENSSNALSVVATHDSASDVNDPTYTIALAVDGTTITKTGANGLATALALNYSSAVLYTAEDAEVIAGTKNVGDVKTPAKINLVDKNGGSGFSVLSSVEVDDFIGDGIVESSSYNASTGILSITFKGQSSPTEIDLGALLDIEDIVIKSDSTDFLSFAAVSPAPGSDAGQAQIGVKLADVTYTATQGNTPADLSVSTTNGKILDASDAIPAIKNYVDDVLSNASTSLAVTAEGDNYVSASVDASTDNKHVVVSTNTAALTASAGTPGVYGTDGSQTTAPVAGTLSGTANKLGDASDIASKVKTYVDGAIAIEGARSDAKNLADIAALDVTDAAVAGKVVTAVSEADGLISVSRDYLADQVLTNMDTTSTATTDVAATDSLGAALMKLQNQITALETATGNMCYSVDGTTLIFNGIPECPAQSGGGED